MPVPARLAAALSAVILLSAPAAAQNRVYAGQEAAALKCAHLFSFTSVALEREGVLSTRDQELMTTWSFLILERYVSGSFDQKMAALRAMSDRYGFLGTILEFEEQGEACLRQFPL